MSSGLDNVMVAAKEAIQVRCGSFVAESSRSVTVEDSEDRELPKGSSACAGRL